LAAKKERHGYRKPSTSSEGGEEVYLAESAFDAKDSQREGERNVVDLQRLVL
jgi:hypothetical protein